MSTSCADLPTYLHDPLAPLDRVAFERHLLRCPRCQAAVEDYMQLIAAGAELARRPNRPRAFVQEEVPAPVVPLRAARRKRWITGGALASAAAAFLLFLRLSQPSVEQRVADALGPHRPGLERLPYAPLGSWRAYAPDRGARAAEPIPVEVTAEVARHGDTAALVAVLLARGDLDDAERKLAAAGSDDELEIERGVLARARNQPAEALRRFDGVLARAPRQGVAAWNRALVLGELRLPHASAEALAQVARLGEPGWSTEAIQRTAELRSAEAVRVRAWQAGKRACERLSSSALPDRAVVRAHPQVCRPAFYEAVRVASTREAVLGLLPVAEELDRSAANTAATRLVQQVAAVDPARRQRAVAAYTRLTGASDLSEGEKRLLLEELRRSEQGDLVLGAIPRSGLAGLGEEYIARALAAGDPYFAELAPQLRAEALLTRGDPLGAEVVLTRAVRDCASRDIELRCANLQLALANVYETMHRPSEVRSVARAALDRSRRLGLYWDEGLLFNHLAEAAHFDGEDALMRAYLREALLRSNGECAELRYVQESQAMASLERLGFAQARADLTASPTCDAPPTLARARVIAELARIDGTPEEAATLRAGLEQTRAQHGLSAGQLAYLDGIEGRLLAARDPAAARPLLRRAIATADQVGPYDADAVKARSDAYAALVMSSAGEGDGAATLSLLSEAAGPGLRGPCVLGVMVDAERLLIVARDARSEVVQHFDPKGRTARVVEASSLVPPSIVRALSACARIDVLALPPVFGSPGLLPASLAWSYRGRSSAVTAPPASSPQVVTVADTLPPDELGLPALRTLALAPIPGARHTELRGAQATPARVVSSFAGADAIEVHAHGFVDLGLSDASLIALSPQSDGRFTLGAREISQLQLPRAPLVILAACHAAYTAPFDHEPWGLPRAFLLAGARAVLASPDTIPDAEAGVFFRAVEQRILAGTDPAIALRDERMQRLARDPASWTRTVLLFD